MKKSLKFKINHIWEYLGPIIYPIKPLAGLFFLTKSYETIPFRHKEVILFFFSRFGFVNKTCKREYQKMPWHCG
jgi:hypothetical protein